MRRRLSFDAFFRKTFIHFIHFHRCSRANFYAFYCSCLQVTTKQFFSCLSGLITIPLRSCNFRSSDSLIISRCCEFTHCVKLICILVLPINYIYFSVLFLVFHFRVVLHWISLQFLVISSCMMRVYVFSVLTICFYVTINKP